MKILCSFLLTLLLVISCYSSEWDYRDLRSFIFRDIPLNRLNNLTITGSNFYREGTPKTRIFPAGMVGVTFVNCNLDNILIPTGNFLQNSSNRQIKSQNDLKDWVLDRNNSPIEPTLLYACMDYSANLNPDNIPIERSQVNEIIMKMRETSQQKRESYNDTRQQEIQQRHERRAQAMREIQ